jgi:A1 cistron-splicing factor AAR2
MASSSRPRSSPTIVLEALPPKTFVGIDLFSFNSSPSFRGITALPLGAHFLYTGTDASLSIRHGHWFHIEPSSSSTSSQTLIWHWNTDLECLEQVHDINQNTLIVDSGQPPNRGLVPYSDIAEASRQQYENGRGSEVGSGGTVQQWADLTSYVTQGLLDRILATPSSSNQDVQASPHGISSVSSAAVDVEHIPGLSSSESQLDHDTPLNFIPINLKRTWREGAVGRERTESALDTSWYLSHLMDSVSTNGDRKLGAVQVLGELQFCFVAVLTLTNWSCLQQWKRVLGLLLGCRRAVGEIEGYFVEVLRVLRLQMECSEVVEGGLFEFKEEGSSGWLRSLLSGFKDGVKDVHLGKGLLWEGIAKLEEFMKETYGWEVSGNVLKRGLLELEDGERVEMDMNEADEEDETGDYAPVVVDLGEAVDIRPKQE